MVHIVSIKIAKRVELHVLSDEDINYNSMLSLYYMGNYYYFRPVEVNVSLRETTAVLEERGYWARRLNRQKDIAYKNLIGRELDIVTDTELIKKIDIESTYC